MQLMGIASLQPSYAPIWVTGKPEIFLQRGLDRNLVICPSGSDPPKLADQQFLLSLVG
jgi:hypothetical protein